MKIFLLSTSFAIVTLCNSAEYRSPNVYELLIPARRNCGLSARIRHPLLPRLSFTEQDIAIPVPNLANVEIPFAYPILNIPSRFSNYQRLLQIKSGNNCSVLGILHVKEMIINSGYLIL